ncbi:WD40-repeat-containing domain protein [Mycena floridula]|nr:WD40-repeat-containing domain protein [Mycena floridula]
MQKPDEEEVQPPQRPPSPPAHTTFAARGVHPPTFSAFKPREVRLTPSQATSVPWSMSHVAWSCDGKKLAAVGVDKVTRVWNSEKNMDARSASMFSGGHSEDVDYVSWNPTHPELFCTTSQKDKHVVFWDARQSRNLQQCQTKGFPMQTSYAPDGRSLLYTTTGQLVFRLAIGPQGDKGKEQWSASDLNEKLSASSVTFNNVGDGLILTFPSEHAFRVLDYPSLTVQETPAAHVGGCVAVAVDPRGRYLASGGHDSIVNIFDTSDWICARTISSCEHAIHALSFSYDGEYIAIASSGSYIDICATETGVPLHRIATSGPSSTVSWHPGRNAIAYCGQTKSQGGPVPAAFVGVFGLLE